MYRYRSENESRDTYSLDRISREYTLLYDRPVYTQAHRESFMERLQRLISENFFFRIEGVDEDSGSEQPGDGELPKKQYPVAGKGFSYDQAPEVIVESPKSDLSKKPTELDLSTTTQPTQLSCLSISIYSAVVIGMVCIFLFIGRDYVKYILFSLEQADFWISLIVFCVLFTIVSFPMTWGYILLNISAGYLYGLVLGLVIVVSCALTGLFIAHCVIRRCLRNFVLTKFTNKSFVSIMNVVDHSSLGFKVVIWARLTPIPFGLQNALFAVCGISTHRYILASALGMLPTQGMHAYIGSTLRSMEEVISNSSGSSTAYLVFGAQLIIAIGLLCFVIRRARAEFDKMVQNASSAPSTPAGVANGNTNNNSSSSSSPLLINISDTDLPTLLPPSSPKSDTGVVVTGSLVAMEKAHSRSASMPGVVPQNSQLRLERSRTGSFSPKPVTREHSH